MNTSLLLGSLHVLLVVAVCIRVLLRPYRQPASRIAWIVVVIAVPFVGIAAYILFGEVNIGRKRIARMNHVMSEMPAPAAAAVPQAIANGGRDERFAHLFQIGQSISALPPVTGNSGELMGDSNATIDAMVADIDAAQKHVHLLFYIWLPDNNGGKIARALERASERGVTVRAMADGLGSRQLIRSRHWSSMREAGVNLAIALPLGNVLLRMRPLAGRIDLRNHRKILVIDGHITYCGSQNCADPEFLPKARYGPWVDAVIRFEGPVALQNQFLFACDWMSHVDEDIRPLLQQEVRGKDKGFIAQAFGTGPTVRFSAMPEMFESVMHAARRQMVITTPYFVPNESMMESLCACAYRGVATTIIFPARNDSLIVGAASRSYYSALIDAGVNIFEFSGGLLHTKSLTVDGELCLIGSANMDQRSFDLNYENNILFIDPELTTQVYRRQQEYIASSTRVTSDSIAQWSLPHRLWNNTVAVLGPVL